MCACAIEQYVVSAITEVIRPTPGTWRARSLADTALGGVWHDVFELMPKGDVKAQARQGGDGEGLVGYTQHARAELRAVRHPRQLAGVSGARWCRRGGVAAARVGSTWKVVQRDVIIAFARAGYP